jgi:hypothetical protein
VDRVEHSQNRATNTVTDEMNFGLRSAENGASRVTRQTWTTVYGSENCCYSSRLVRRSTPLPVSYGMIHQDGLRHMPAHVAALSLWDQAL